MAEEEHQTNEGDILEDTSGTPDTGSGEDAGASSDEGQSKSSPTPSSGDILDNEGTDEAKSKAGGDVLSDDDDADDEGVPDQYTLDFEKLGLAEDSLQEGLLEEFQGKAKELGLTQKQFEGLAEYDLERAKVAESEAVDAWHERVNGWREAARSDKEFGGKDYDANRRVALQAMEKFGDADLRSLMTSPSEDNPEGLAIGNHPAMLRFLHRVGKALGDPDLVLGEDAQRTDDTEARLRRLYPSMYNKSA